MAEPDGTSVSLALNILRRHLAAVPSGLGTTGTDTSITHSGRTDGQ
jgi:hypothetical protein